MNRSAGRSAAVLGGTGFLGRALVPRLLADGWRVVVTSRRPEKAAELFGPLVRAAFWEGRRPAALAAAVEGADVVVNLIGENIGRGRWTRKKKASIMNSRLQSGRALAEAVRLSSAKPSLLIQASAVGFYGDRGEGDLGEDAPAGKGFLAEVVRKWEESTNDVDTLGVRRILLRSASVLDRSGGALPKILLPFRFFAGGPLGSGKQWFPWISLEDEVRAILFLAGLPGACGAYNLASPGTVRQFEMARALGAAVRRPAWLPIGKLPLKIVLGQKADEMLLVSQKVRPRRLTASGFVFKDRDIGVYLRSLFRRRHAR